MQKPVESALNFSLRDSFDVLEDMVSSPKLSEESVRVLYQYSLVYLRQ